MTTSAGAPPDCSAATLPRGRGLKESVRHGALGAIRAVLRVRSRAGPPAPDGETVVIAPHPDDAEFGCGGLIWARRRAGLAVTIVCVTDGAGSHPGHPRLAPEALGRQRRAEAIAAAAALGVPMPAVTFLGAPDGRLAGLGSAASRGLTAALAAVFAKRPPAQVFVPYRHDHSSEHEAVYGLVRSALAAASAAARVLEYPVWAAWNPRFLGAAAWGRHRIWRHEVGAARPVKRNAIALHRSQTQPTPPWPRAVLPPGFDRCFDTTHEYYFEL